MADAYNAMLRDVQAIVRSANGDIHSDFNACMFRDGYRKQADEITCLRNQLARAREFHAAELADMSAERDQLRQYLDAAQRRGEELRAQVAALEGDADELRKTMTAVSDALDYLHGMTPQQAAAVRVDALRYRWLRDNSCPQAGYGMGNPRGEQLDNAIDAALAKGG